MDIRSCKENSKFWFLYRLPLMTIFDQLSSLSCWPSWMTAINRNYKKDIYHSQIQHGDLEQKLNTTTFESVFNFKMLAILDGNHYHNSEKWLHHSQSQNRELQLKPNTTKFGSIFIFNVLLALLDGSHYQTQ